MAKYDTKTGKPAAIPISRPANWFYFRMIKQAASNWLEDNCPRLAAALAFYTFLSLAPLLVISVKVISIFLSSDKATQQVQDQITQLVGSVGKDAITQMTSKAGQPGAGVLATVVSFVILAVSATGVFVELQDSMNIIWEVRAKPNQGIWRFIRTRLLSLAMVFAIAFILLVSLFVSTVVTGITNHIAPGVAVLTYGIDLVASLVVITLLFAMIFKFLPDARIQWRNVWIGAIITSGLFILGKFGLSLYFKFGSTTSAYGAAGSLAAVLIWVYYSAQLVFFGAEFTRVFAQATGHRIEPDAHAVTMTEQERIARGIPHEDVANAAASSSRSLRRIRPAQPSWQRADLRRRSAASAGAVGAAAGLAAGAVIAYFGRDRFDKVARRLRINAAARDAAQHLQARIDRAEQKLIQVSLLRDRVNRLDLGNRIDAIERQVRDASKWTAEARRRPPSRNGWIGRIAEKLSAI